MCKRPTGALWESLLALLLFEVRKGSTCKWKQHVLSGFSLMNCLSALSPGTLCLVSLPSAMCSTMISALVSSLHIRPTALNHRPLYRCTVMSVLQQRCQTPNAANTAHRSHPHHFGVRPSTPLLTPWCQLSVLIFQYAVYLWIPVLDYCLLSSLNLTCAPIIYSPNFGTLIANLAEHFFTVPLNPPSLLTHNRYPCQLQFFL